MKRKIQRVKRKYERNIDSWVYKYLQTLTISEVNLLCSTEDNIKSMWDLPFPKLERFRNLLVSNYIVHTKITELDKYNELNEINFNLDKNQVRIIKANVLSKYSITSIYVIRRLDLCADLKNLILSNYLFLIYPLSEFLNLKI